MHSSIHTFIYSTIHLFNHSSNQPFIYSHIHIFTHSSTYQFNFSPIHLSPIHLFNLSSIHQFIYSLIHLFTYPSIHPFIYSHIHLFTHSSIHTFIYLSVHLFTHSSMHPFIYSPIRLYTHSQVHPFIHSYPSFHSSIFRPTHINPPLDQFNHLSPIHPFTHWSYFFLQCAKFESKATPTTTRSRTVLSRSTGSGYTAGATLSVYMWRSFIRALARWRTFSASTAACPLNSS